MLYHRTCAYCHAKFNTRIADKAYCSMFCEDLAANGVEPLPPDVDINQGLERICPYCDREYKAKNRYQIYCSTACRKLAEKSLKTDYCVKCGVFIPNRKPQQKYCSKCKVLAKAEDARRAHLKRQCKYGIEV